MHIGRSASFPGTLPLADFGLLGSHMSSPASPADFFLLSEVVHWDSLPHTSCTGLCSKRALSYEPLMMCSPCREGVHLRTDFRSSPSQEEKIWGTVSRGVMPATTWEFYQIFPSAFPHLSFTVIFPGFSVTTFSRYCLTVTSRDIDWK